MIIIGSDHGGFALKQQLIDYLTQKGVRFVDKGTFTEDSVDYPDIAQAVCDEIGDGDLGVLICGTGIGISIAANKHAGIRAALCCTEYSAKMAREHNDANVLCLGGRVIGVETAKAILDEFLSSSFSGGRHLNRVSKIEKE